MRPKKRVLMIDDYEEAASVRKVSLMVHSYYVAVATSCAAALEILQAEPEFDVVVCRLETEGYLRLAAKMRRACPWVPLLLFNDGARRRNDERGKMLFAGGATVWGNLDTEQLLHAIKVLKVKHSGPRKKPVQRELPPQMYQRLKEA